MPKASSSFPALSPQAATPAEYAIADTHVLVDFVVYLQAWLQAFVGEGRVVGGAIDDVLRVRIGNAAELQLLVQPLRRLLYRALAGGDYPFLPKWIAAPEAAVATAVLLAAAFVAWLLIRHSVGAKSPQGDRNIDDLFFFPK